MKKLILHVGPPKCGSSTIQHFFSNQPKPCAEKIRFQILQPRLINDLNQASPSADSWRHLDDIFSASMSEEEILILSHEFLFQCPSAVIRIATVGRVHSFETRIVGFCRRQSDYLVSAYSQWFFRDRTTL